MAMIQIGSAKLTATYISPWVDRNFPEAESEAMAVGPRRLDWKLADSRNFTSYFRGEWLDYKFPNGVLASSAVGEYTPSGSVDKNEHHVQFMVGRSELSCPTTTLEKSAQQASFIGFEAGDVYDNLTGYRAEAAGYVAQSISKLSSGLSVSAITEYSDLKFVVEENDLFKEYRKSYSHRLGVQVVLPSSKLKLLLQSGQSHALKLFNDFELRLEPPVTTDSARAYPVDPAQQQGWMAYCRQPFIFNVIAKSHTSSIRVPIYVDTETMAVSLVIDASEIDDVWGRAVAAMKSYNVKLAEALNLAKAGLLTEANKAPTTRPSATVDKDLTDEQRRYCNDWWDQYLVVANDVNKHASDLKANQTNDELNAKDGTNISVDDRISSSKGSVGDGFDIDWSSILSGTGELLSSAGSKAFELLKEWGPTGVLTAWAGYKAVSSASKSSIPPWLIIGGFAVVTLAVLN